MRLHYLNSEKIIRYGSSSYASSDDELKKCFFKKKICIFYKKIWTNENIFVFLPRNTVNHKK